MGFKDGWPARLVAIGTTVYSVTMTVAPKLLAKPMGLTTPAGTVPATTASLIRSIGTRDVALAVALLVAPTGYPMKVLTAARVISDGADAVWLGQVVNEPSMRKKISGVALGWAALEALVGFTRLGQRKSLR